MIRAVLFDFDGLIRDTETKEYESFRMLYRAYGAELPLERYLVRIGGEANSFNPYDHLLQGMGSRTGLDLETARRERRSYYDQLMEHEFARPGVEEYLSAAKRLGLLTGLVSSAPLDWVMPNLEQLKLTEQFDCILTHEDAVRVKPDPELYIKALARLNIGSAEAVAFEDSPNGAAAAKAAGLHTVIVPNDLTRPLRFEAYDMRLNSMLDLSLDQLIGYFHNAGR
ncbi:HAD-IA family hydrolase [Paenibacillus doosanensis]|uniref:HAD-IA family hydrolase n=1 Tax=Paenibacillus doosanensis TaxID=1229154 RepID=UPI0021801DBE|nr:HAD-IA family hydrolase [Paenibacillus doosanensis]MCS7462343.1 HAD-IA family hydrolase [Paenibacillus doosanensis]